MYFKHIPGGTYLGPGYLRQEIGIARSVDEFS